MNNNQLSLWDFACNYYRQPKVQSACLRLQDEQGWNVPLLLFCCWAADRYGALSTEQIQHAKNLADGFSRYTTEPLRQIRQNMKSVDNNRWPVNHVRWQKLRQDIKDIELESEKILLNALELPYKNDQQRSGTLEAVIDALTICFGPFPSSSPVIRILEALYPDQSPINIIEHHKFLDKIP